METALAHAMPREGGGLDMYADVLTAFYPLPELLALARFGRWRRVRELAVAAEAGAYTRSLFSST